MELIKAKQMVTSDIHYGEVKQLVYTASGLELSIERYPPVRDLLDQFVRETPHTLPQLLTSLAHEPITTPLWRGIIELVTVGETYFFRNGDQFAALREHVLPPLIEQRRASGLRYLSLWSAGCATGEEPYSLAILLQELMPDLSNWTVSILGTDINRSSLETARRAVYKPFSFRSETPATLLPRWFTLNGKGYELQPAIQRMVSFAPLNLVTDEYPSFETRTQFMDIIVCRNVTIYFDKATTQRVIERFYQALKPGGWLIVGHAEPLISTYAAFLTRNFPNAIFYQKPFDAPLFMGAAQPAELAPTAPVPPEPIIQPVSPITIEPVTPSPAVDVMSKLSEAQAAANREDWQTAQALLSDIARVQPFQAEMHYLRAMVLLHTGTFTDTMSALRQALYCLPSFALAHYALGELYAQRQQWIEATRSWQAARNHLEQQDATAQLMPGDDLTVEMLLGVLELRLAQLPPQIKKDAAK